MTQKGSSFLHKFLGLFALHLALNTGIVLHPASSHAGFGFSAVSQFTNKVRLLALDACESALRTTDEPAALPQHADSGLPVAVEAAPGGPRRIPIDTVPHPHLGALEYAITHNQLELSDMVEAIYENAYDPMDIFSPEQWQQFQKFSAVESLINRGLVILTAPVWVPMAVVASIITKLESPGPIVFVQTRVGQAGKPFRIYKLRTMRQGVAGPSYTQENDPRITRFGAHFRRWKVDELFQFYNVLRGEMNIIGRRPLVENEAFAALNADPRYGWIFMEKPGLASLGQISCSHCSTPEENLRKFEVDLFGMIHKSPKMFARIFLGAAIAILRGTGAR